MTPGAHTPDNRETLSHAEWVALGKRLHGVDPMGWVFECVRCGHHQTMADFVAAGMTKEEAQTRAYFSCIGRWVDGVGCDWTLGGLLLLHTREVTTVDGENIPVFRFAGEATGGAS